VTASDKIWFITGTSSGFGRVIAEAALQAGDTVVATARRPEALDDLVAAHPGRVSAVALDVTDTARITDVVAEVVDRHGRIDVLVNNAGRALIGAVEETTDQELRDLMDVHFFGPAALTRAVLPHMRAQKSGAIVQITSMGGRISFPGVSAYSATKFALEGLSESLAAEAAPFGITVLIVEPGAFRTGLQGAAMQMSAELPGYADVVGPVRAGMRAVDGNQPGDPAKAAAAIIAALAADHPPLRLPLGSDAADSISARTAADQADFAAWEGVIRGTDFDT
jgi:NAD(P)-dependent dehydrogenase (short-subunit alcohol dehydrogenase family)